MRIAGRHLAVSGLLFQESAWHGDLISFRATSTQPATEGRNTKWVSVYAYRNRVDHSCFAVKRHLGQTLVVCNR